MNRFFVDSNNIKNSKIFITDKDDIKHIKKVLRLKNNEEIEISDNEQYEYIARIINVDENPIECEIITQNIHKNELPYNIDLFQGVPQKSKLELIIQKNVELGITNIYPLRVNRCQGVNKEKFDTKLDRYNQISKSAAEQSKRGIIPEVKKLHTFKECLGLINEYDLFIFCYEDETKTTLKEVLTTFKKSKLNNNLNSNISNDINTIPIINNNHPNTIVQNNMKDKDDASLKTNKKLNIAVLIGPEGGIAEDEVNLLISNNAISASLGKSILRTETAGIVALSMINYELAL
ncbi:MAG: RsmE family RNA methyltransferase [Eubacteriales bacterium]|nr:RsmE family RNA methyltransferase [Eubacteriales bacterium]MDY3333295.1 RsmE family RNA methyltransferase [Gallibacter sp.]